MVVNVKKFESMVHGGGDPRLQPRVYFTPTSAPNDPSRSSFVNKMAEASLAAIEKGGVAGHAEIAPPKSFAGISRFR